MKDRPRLDKNPLYKKHFYENLSLAEKVRLQKKYTDQKFSESNNSRPNASGGPWTTHRSDMSSARSDEKVK